MAHDAATLERLTGYLTGRSDPPKRDKIRVSSAGDCSRKLGYHLLGFPSSGVSVAERITFEIGHAYHRMLQQWLVEMGWVVPELIEFRLDDGPGRVGGTCDAVTGRLNLQGEPDDLGTRRLVEIKSITNVAQERYGGESRGAFTRLAAPRTNHLDQATIYADLWNRQLAGGPERLPLDDADPIHDRVEHLTFFYVGKDTAEVPVKVFTQKLSSVRSERLWAKFARVWGQVDHEELPERDYNPFAGYPPCSFCPYRALCMAGLAE